MVYLRVGAAGALGSLLRYLLVIGLAGLWPHPFPWAVLLVNLLGSFLLGLLAGYFLHGGLISPLWRVPLTVGLLGGFTTFSTWTMDTILLWESGSGMLAAANVLISVGLGVPAALVGLALTNTTPSVQSDRQSEPR